MPKGLALLLILFAVLTVLVVVNLIFNKKLPK